MQYNFTINDTPPSQNLVERSAYSMRAKLRNAWTEYFQQAMKQYRIPAAAGKRKVSYTIYFGYQSRRDSQNYLTKGVIDAMSRSGLLIDDNPRWMQIEFPTIALALGNKHTDFVVEDLNGPDV